MINDYTVYYRVASVNKKMKIRATTEYSAGEKFEKEIEKRNMDHVGYRVVQDKPINKRKATKVNNGTDRF